MPGIDLHTHSVRSDGTNTVTENVGLARDRGLGVVALTDHDTTDGLDEAAAAAGEGGDRAGAGGGVQADRTRVRSIHVLAYSTRTPRIPSSSRSCSGCATTRFHRGELMVEKLQALQRSHISFERVRTSAARTSSPAAHRAGTGRGRRRADGEGRVPPRSSSPTAAAAQTSRSTRSHPLDALALIRHGRRGVRARAPGDVGEPAGPCRTS